MCRGAGWRGQMAAREQAFDEMARYADFGISRVGLDRREHGRQRTKTP